jgi:S-adenosylmethionine hydrolase
VIAYVDGYGNLKTTIAYDPKKVRPGQCIRLRVNEREQKATVSDGAFGVGHGELAFAPGSSGWPLQSVTVRWVEIFLRGGSAWELFKQPPVGSSITIA